MFPQNAYSHLGCTFSTDSTVTCKCLPITICKAHSAMRAISVPQAAFLRCAVLSVSSNCLRDKSQSHIGSSKNSTVASKCSPTAICKAHSSLQVFTNQEPFARFTAGEPSVSLPVVSPYQIRPQDLLARFAMRISYQDLFRMIVDQICLAHL